MPTGFPNRQLRDSWVAGSRRPAILTKMTDPAWISVLKVFEASRSRRGDKGRDDKNFLSALHYGSFVVLALGFILIKSVHTA